MTTHTSAANARPVAAIWRCPTVIDALLEVTFDEAWGTTFARSPTVGPLRANAFHSVWFAHQRIGRLRDAQGMPGR